MNFPQRVTVRYMLRIDPDVSAGMNELGVGYLAWTELDSPRAWSMAPHRRQIRVRFGC